MTPKPPFGARGGRDDPNESAELAARDEGVLPLYSEAASELTVRTTEEGLAIKPPAHETRDVSMDAYIAHRMNCVESRDIGALWDRAERLAFRNITVRIALGTHLSDVGAGARVCEGA